MTHPKLTNRSEYTEKTKKYHVFFEKWEEIPLLLCCIEIRRLSCHYGLTEKRTQSTLNIIVKGHHFV